MFSIFYIFFTWNIFSRSYFNFSVQFLFHNRSSNIENASSKDICETTERLQQQSQEQHHGLYQQQERQQQRGATTTTWM
jgi:hypothetical protein